MGTYTEYPVFFFLSWLHLAIWRQFIFLPTLGLEWARRTEILLLAWAKIWCWLIYVNLLCPS